MKKKIDIYPALILSSAVLWGTAGIFVRTAGKLGLSEIQLVSARAFFTALILGICMLFKNKNDFKIKIKDIWLFLCSGIFSILLFNYCYYKTMALSSLSAASVLLYTAPFFVMLFSLFLFKEKLTVNKTAATVIAFLGCFLATGAVSSSSIGSKALVFGLLTGFGYSLYTVFGRILLSKGYNSYTITFYTFLFSFAGCLLFVNVKSVSALIFGDLRLTAVTVLMAAVNSVIPYLLYTAGLSGVSPSAAPVMATVETVSATVVGVAVYGEPLNVYSVLGIICIFSAVIILNIKSNDKIKVKAYAKLNLSLAVIAKRNDGYHALDTVMQTVDLYDTLVIKKSDGISAECDGKPCDSGNIVLKAAEIFFNNSGIKGGADISLKKRIPVAAGMGGGSADAAAVLSSLNKLYGMPFSYEELCSISKQVGADVPFLIRGGTQRAMGVGEQLTPLATLKSGCFIIVKNGDKPSTKEMFLRLDSAEYINPDVELTVNALEKEDMPALCKSFGNAFSSLWQNDELKNRLRALGADGAELSGSGPAVFAYFTDAKKAKKAFKILKKQKNKVYIAKPVC